MLTNRREIRIEFGDCDPGGIVYFPRYFEYSDACTNSLFERAGLPKKKMLQTYAIAGIPMVEVRAQFMAPSTYGETVAFESSVIEWGRRSFSVRHRVSREDGVLAAEIVEKRVWVVRQKDGSFRGEPIPKEVKARFAGSAAGKVRAGE